MYIYNRNLKVYITEILKYVLWDLMVGQLNYRGLRVIALTKIALEGLSAAFRKGATGPALTIWCGWTANYRAVREKGL